jgi:catechol 2,3-dioxygenase-like lactoylglutathione lyase family enzyme
MSQLAFRHVGIVVPDIEAARSRLTELLGIEFGQPREVSIAIKDGQGNRQEVSLRICLTPTEPGFELIEEAPGTVWVCNEHSNLHHVAFFPEDIAADSARLIAASCPLQMSMGIEDDALPLFTYHRDSLGVTIELSRVPLRS